MKVILRVLILIQLSELICYGYLFQFISNHDKEMFRNSIISTDIYKRRKQENAFSGFKQFILFVYRFNYSSKLLRCFTNISPLHIFDLLQNVISLIFFFAALYEVCFNISLPCAVAMCANIFEYCLSAKY